MYKNDIISSNTVCNQLLFMQRHHLWENFSCMNSSASKITCMFLFSCFCTCRPTFRIQWLKSDSALTFRAWFSTFMMSSSCCFLRARVSWSLPLMLLIWTWYSITAGEQQEMQHVTAKPQMLFTPLSCVHSQQWQGGERKRERLQCDIIESNITLAKPWEQDMRLNLLNHKDASISVWQIAVNGNNKSI